MRSTVRECVWHMLVVRLLLGEALTIDFDNYAYYLRRKT